MAPRLPSRCWSAGHLQRLVAHHDATAVVGHAPTWQPQLLNLPRTTKRGVKVGWSTLPHRFKPLRFKYNEQKGLPEPTTGPAAALKRKERTTPLRTGVLATKKGMTSLYTKRGNRIPCTVLQLEDVQVLAQKNVKTHGYWAVQVGAVGKRAVTETAPMLGYFEAKGVEPKQHVVEFRVRNEDGLLPVGVQLMPDWFHIGQWVDVRSNSRGQGFAGGMKRHGFSGQEASHGNSLNHRTMGSTGASQGSGSRVLPGKKMPGRMGNERVTVQNLAVLSVDNDLGIVVVKGCVAGPKGCIVRLQDAVKKPPPPQEWIDKSRQVLLDRAPGHEEALQLAREKHLELKEQRRSGTIADLVAAFDPLKINRRRPEEREALEKLAEA